MLHRAVASHDASAPKQQSLSQKLFPSSSPTRQPSPSAKNRAFNTSSNNVLRSNQTSLHNASVRKPFVNPVNSVNVGIKRTHSGLAKAIGGQGSFEEARKPNSQQFPIRIDENSPVKSNAPKVIESDYFDADDFDSDIDLDVEDPTVKNPVTYPSLPTTSTIPSKPIFYPTLPKRQIQDTNSRRPSPDDSGYGGSLPPMADALDSSMPIPWSSSPAEQRHSPAKTIRNFAYNGGETHVAKPSVPLPAAKIMPAKRSKLPWQDSQVAQVEQNGPPLVEHAAAALRSRPTNSSVNFTPLPKDNKKVSYAWNTTASAVKESQKTLREINKKKSKFNEATEKTAMLINKKKTRNSVARVFLSEEQQHVLDLVSESKKSVFFTGSAGTGKSVLLREIISTLRKKHVKEPDRVAVCASTGLAACNIGGVTLHSFAGIGLGKEEVPELVKKIRRNQKAKHRWMRTKILVVDEISMVDGELFDKLEQIARQLRNNGRPFGGIQLVITGDFFQLPPVPDYNKIAKFAFDATSWITAIEHTIGLHHVFRQKDPVFAGMLNEMREGRLSQSSIAAFQKLSRPLEATFELEATELFPTRNEVETANHRKMAQLVGETMTFEARDGGTITDVAQRTKLLANCMAPEIITFKKGAQVMLIKNIDEGLVNGSLGRVIGFMSEQTFDKYTAHEEDFHSTQGGTIEDGVDPLADKRSKAAARIQDNLLGSTSRLWPVVRFTLSDNTTRDLLCQPENWKVELPNGEVQASRAQVPLILAWALSIHKAQGQTLERVKVDLGKVFEKGQAYVALSRATNMGGLQVLRFDPKKVQAHEKVRTFYQNLSRVESLEKGQPTGAAKKKKSGLAAEDYERNFMEEGW